ncbi:MAG: hypothetical protein WC614_03595 [bacterium]
MIKQNIGFFDACSREMDESGTKLVFRSRVVPIGEKLNKLYDIASTRNIPILFTTCCAGRMPEKNVMPDVLFIPMDTNNNEWVKNVKNYHQFYIQKNPDSEREPQLSYICEYHDAFKHNSNAIRLIEMLDISHWIAFGNGFDFCVTTGIRTLVKMKKKVTLITDVLIRATDGTDENYNNLMEEFHNLGVYTTTLEELLKSL